MGRETLFLKSTFPPSYQESSRLRELSISFFRDLVGSGGRYRKRMKNYARSVLVPLFLRMSDQTDGVAKVRISEPSTDPEKGVLTPHGWPGHQRQGRWQLAALP